MRISFSLHERIPDFVLGSIAIITECFQNSEPETARPAKSATSQSIQCGSFLLWSKSSAYAYIIQRKITDLLNVQ